jgi:hypothetical protein
MAKGGLIGRNEELFNEAVEDYLVILNYLSHFKGRYCNKLPQQS